MIKIYDEPEQWMDIWTILKERINPSPTECDELITDTSNPFKYIASITYKNYPYLVIDHTILDKSVVTRSFITTILDYCFTKRPIIRSFVKGNNTKSNKFMQHLGFIQEGKYRQYFQDGDDFNIYSMTREEWNNNPFRRIK